MINLPLETVNNHLSKMCTNVREVKEFVSREGPLSLGGQFLRLRQGGASLCMMSYQEEYTNLLFLLFIFSN